MAEATSNTPPQDIIHEMGRDDYVVNPCRNGIINFNGSKYPAIGTMINRGRGKVWTIFCPYLVLSSDTVCDLDKNTCDFRK